MNTLSAVEFTTDTGIHVSIGVRDLEASVAFYTRLFNQESPTRPGCFLGFHAVGKALVQGQVHRRFRYVELRIARPNFREETALLPKGSRSAYNLVMSVRKTARRGRASSKPVIDRIILRPSADSLADVQPLLARIINALGTNSAARLLGVDPAQVSRWAARTGPVSAEMGGRIVDLHDVLTRILRVYHRETVAMWLVGSEPLLGGARPVDVLASEGASPLIRTIDGLTAGACA